MKKLLLFFFLFIRLEAIGQPACDHSLFFSGNGSHVNCGPGNQFNLEGQLTVEAWVNLEHNVYPQYIVGNFDNSVYSGFQLAVQNGNMFCAVRDSVFGTRAISISGVPDSVWTHLAFTYKSGARFRGYVNGRMLFDIPASSYRIGSHGNVPFVIGACPFNTDTFETHGWIDEVRVYNLERSASAIRQDMRTLINGPTSGLIGYWSFGEGMGLQTADISGNQHQGIFNGLVYPVWYSAEGPYGHGSSSLQIAATSGVVTFPGTSLQLDYIGTPADTVVVTHIDCYPNQLPSGGAYYPYSYWVIDRYGMQPPVSSNQQYKLTPGAVSLTDSVNPANLLLCHRDGFSVNSWTTISAATMASVANSTIDFQGIAQTGQFIFSSTSNSFLGIEKSLVDHIQLYPNPAANWCKLTINNDVHGTLGYFIYDAFGRCVMNKVEVLTDKNLLLDTSDLPDGVYQIVLQFDGNTLYKKFNVLKP